MNIRASYSGLKQMRWQESRRGSEYIAGGKHRSRKDRLFKKKKSEVKCYSKKALENINNVDENRIPSLEPKSSTALPVLVKQIVMLLQGQHLCICKLESMHSRRPRSDPEMHPHTPLGSYGLKILLQTSIRFRETQSMSNLMRLRQLIQQFKKSTILKVKSKDIKI